MTDILCLGEPLVEFVRLDDGTYKRGFGGDTSNAAIAAARQGASVGFITALGADRFGDSIIDLWTQEGVDTAHVLRDPDAPTGIYFVDPDPAGRFFTYYRAGSAASQLQGSDLPDAAIKSARCLHLSGITLAVSEALRAASHEAMRMAVEAGVAVSLDTNLRLKLWDIGTASDETQRAARLARIVVTSVDDSEHLLGQTDPAHIADIYRDLGAEIVLVTMGAEGCHLATDVHQVHIPAAPSTPIDSTGAGDSFAGAFLAWWLETGDTKLAAHCAAKVAAGTVSGLGAVDPIPRREQVVTEPF
ncbi:MAG: sugar kinase [Pseudomonadota bacterium]